MSFDWASFTDGAASALWSDTYISNIEGLVEDGNIARDDARGALVPDSGGRYDDYVPEVPGAARREAKKYVAELRRSLSSSALAALEASRIDAERLGWLAMMGALGHGTTLHDENIPVRVPHTEATFRLHNAAFTAIKRAAKQHGVRIRST